MTVPVRFTTQLRNGTGAVLAGKPVTVTQAGSLTPATLYRDASALIAQDNPVVSDVSNGQVDFYAAPGQYDLYCAGALMAEGIQIGSADQVTLASFVVSGTLTVAAGVVKVPAPFDATITGVRLAVGTAPTGAAILVDVNKAGTTIFTTQANRPTIAISATSGGPGAAPDVASVAAGDLLSVDVDQIGSVVAGANLAVIIMGIRR